MSFQLIVSAIIEVSIRGTTVVLYEFAAKQRKKNLNLGLKFLCKNVVQLGMDLKKLQKQGRYENTRRVSYCRKVVVEKDQKTTLHVLPFSLSLLQPFCSRIFFLCFHPFLVSVLFTGPFLIVVNYRSRSNYPNSQE